MTKTTLFRGLVLFLTAAFLTTLLPISSASGQVPPETAETVTLTMVTPSEVAAGASAIFEIRRSGGSLDEQFYRIRIDSPAGGPKVSGPPGADGRQQEDRGDELEDPGGVARLAVLGAGSIGSAGRPGKAAGSPRSESNVSRPWPRCSSVAGSPPLSSVTTIHCSPLQ